MKTLAKIIGKQVNRKTGKINLFASFLLSNCLIYFTRAKYNVCMKVTTKTCNTIRLLVRLFFFIFFSISVSSISLADGLNPDELGPYKVGYTTLPILMDPTRNPDGSVGTQGRPLYIQVWYPVTENCPSCNLAQYSVNNPIYDGTHSGYPLIFVPIFYTSQNRALAHTITDTQIASGTFPLVIFSHGNGGGPVDGFIHETLASHGYIVAAVEHTGNSVIRNLGFNLVPPVNSPGLSSGIGRYIQRANDVNFVISQLILWNPQNCSPTCAAPELLAHIDSQKIGVYGYSRGGATSMLTATGVAGQGLPKNPLVKAVADLDGDLRPQLTGLTASDYAQATVPIMLYGDASNGQNPYVLPQLINSPEKYYIDVANSMHFIPNLEDYCSLRGHTDLLAVENGVPNALADVLQYYSFFKFSYTQVCSSSVYEGISDSTIAAIGGDPAEINFLKPLMPLREQLPAKETERLTRLHVVSFFDKALKGQDDKCVNPTNSCLSNSQLNQVMKPLIDFHKNCVAVPNHPQDLQSGDKITFTPSANQYVVAYSKGNSLLDKGTSKLILFDDDAKGIELPFAYPVPGHGLQRQKIWVSSNGAITSIAPLGVDSGEGHGTPWSTRGDLLLSGQLTIAASMLDLDPPVNPNGGVFYKVESNRVIVTYDAVPVFLSAEKITIQVVINANGIIEIIIGSLPATGSGAEPNTLGNIGVAFGDWKAKHLRKINPIDFSAINKPIKMSPSGIFEQFYLTNGVSMCGEEE